MPVTEYHGRHEAKRRQSLTKICVERTNAGLKQWRPLQRFTRRRDTYAETRYQF
ncbi:hypothetical protein [Streptomyces spectabilis]|uniref:Transposase DDE domain-containing protein n=1 Tax=Streptomyces spectabilis TaxID=68270 RepID=A0A7W8F0P4_STRST|nr:hypothetical protein [Streptomyces spectabilis]MBB5109960.1 hypothetical protein [Streptomyces spectabilis]GGV56682.1 hypothetical protein GCM10010245_89670 [Streptomyces spectabilis]